MTDPQADKKSNDFISDLPDITKSNELYKRAKELISGGGTMARVAGVASARESRSATSGRPTANAAAPVTSTAQPNKVTRPRPDRRRQSLLLRRECSAKSIAL